MTFQQTRTRKNTYTLPVICLLVFIVLTYFPLIYKYLPILGQLRLVLVSGIVMLIAYLLNQSHYKNVGIYKSPVVLSWFCLLGIMLLGLVFSLDRGQTLNMIMLNMKYFIVFLVMIKIIDNAQRLNTVIKVFVLCGVGMAMSSIYNYVTDNTEYLLGGQRVLAIDVGLFGDPNDLALFLNATLPFALYLLIKNKKKLIPLVGVLTIIVGIMLTYSRGGFLGLCVTGMAFYFFFASKQKKYLVLLMLLGVVFWSFSPAGYKERLGTITDVKTDTETGMTGTRLDAWRIVVAHSTNWLLGSGAGTSVYLAGESMGDWHALHNSFLQVFVEMGAFALFFYINLFVKPYRQLRRYIGKPRDALAKSDIVLVKAVLMSFLSYGITVIFLPQAYSVILYLLTAIAVIETEFLKKKCVASVPATVNAAG